VTDCNFPTENLVVDFATAWSAKADKVCSFQPSTANAVIERGKAALSQLEQDKHTWSNWTAACLAVLETQTLAMAAAQTNVPHGPRYKKAIKLLLECHGFDRINKGTRSLMCDVARNLPAIESWRSTLLPEKLLELNHPRVVLAHWKRSLRSGSGQDPEESEIDTANPFLQGWNKSSAEQRTAGLTEVGFDDFRQAMPAAWCKPMKDCVARLRAEDRNPDFRITRAIRKALEHLEIANNPKTSTPVAQGHEKDALGELREALKALRGIKRHVWDLDVGISSTPKAKRCST